MRRSCLCNQTKRTAFIAFLKVYCYKRGRQHLEQLKSKYYGTITTLPLIIGSTNTTTTNTTTDSIHAIYVSHLDGED